MPAIRFIPPDKCVHAVVGAFTALPALFLARWQHLPTVKVMALALAAAAVLAGAARLTLRVSGLSAALSAELSESAPRPDAGPDGGHALLTGFTGAAAVLAAVGAAASLPAPPAAPSRRGTTSRCWR